MPDSLGLYFHIPFCVSKCGYCDFYSLCTRVSGDYVPCIKNQLQKWGGRETRPIDTVYFGGGTPSLLGDGIADIIRTAKQNFRFSSPEITVEANPADNLDAFFASSAEAGANRLSLGVQSAVESELAALGRRHGFGEVKGAVRSARKAGFCNLSLDLMLGIPGQTAESLDYSINKFLELSPDHISAYILKIEPDTPFYKKRDTLNLPDEEQTAELYLAACEKLEKAGLCQYEISNFAKSGKESRHNLRYWNCEEYLGFGPSAHSFYKGKRFYYDRNLDLYIKNPTPISDGKGGDASEYVMLRLRLAAGVSAEKFRQRFARSISPAFFEKAKKYEKGGFVRINGENVALTRKGFLVSNTIIGDLYEDI